MIWHKANPGIETRITLEAIKKWKDTKYYYSPRFVSNTRYKIILDKFNKDKIGNNIFFGSWNKLGTKKKLVKKNEKLTLASKNKNGMVLKTIKKMIIFL